jgi:8-oxo-dGTP pyrophosphatase MutT (NUDIX family)
MNSLHLTVAAVIEKRGRFLLVEERVNGALVINQPAGHVEPGETFRAAIVREVLEETAWQFTPAAIIGIYLWQRPDSGERFLRVAFCGSCHAHDPRRQLDDGIVRTLWLDRTELKARQACLRSPMVMRAIDDYRSGARYPVNMFQQLDIDDLASHARVIANPS